MMNNYSRHGFQRRQAKPHGFVGLSQLQWTLLRLKRNFINFISTVGALVVITVFGVYYRVKFGKINI